MSTGYKSRLLKIHPKGLANYSFGVLFCRCYSSRILVPLSSFTTTMMSAFGTRDRILRLRIAHYKAEDKTEEEAHRFGTLFTEKAAYHHA